MIAALPNIFAALKIAAPAAFLGAVLGEFVGGGGDSSVGVALIAAQSHLQSDVLWWVALTSGAVAGIGYVVVALVARLVTPWSSGRRPEAADDRAAAAVAGRAAGRGRGRAGARSPARSPSGSGQSLLIVVVSLAVLIARLVGRPAGSSSINPLVGKTPADVWNFFFNAHPEAGRATAEHEPGARPGPRRCTAC